MLGHAIRLHETNTHAWTWICECGELGTIHTIADWQPGETLLTLRRRELAHDACRAEHFEHCDEVRADIARRSHEALDRHTALVTKANATLQRRGRWGSG